MEENNLPVVSAIMANHPEKHSEVALKKAIEKC